MAYLRSWSLWLFAAIALGIYQARPEISAAISDGGIDYATYAGPLWIKALKDVFIIILWLYLMTLRDPFPAQLRRTVLSCYAITAVGAMLAVSQSGIFLALAGVRWILPLFVLIEMRRLNGISFNHDRITSILIAALIMAIALQIARSVYFPPVWGERWGFSARPPAYFLLPNTNAFFAVACAAIVMDVMGRRHSKTMLALLLATLSAALSQSGGGVLACCVLWLFAFFRRMVVLLPLTIIVGGLFFCAAPRLLGRDDFVDTSAGERLGKLAMAAEELVGTGAFGAYTNAGFILIATNQVTVTGQREAIVSDSFYVSLLGNFGILSVPFVLALLFALIRADRACRRSGVPIGRASVLCLFTFGFSTVFSEAFPMIVMLGAGIWMRSKSPLSPRLPRPSTANELNAR